MYRLYHPWILQKSSGGHFEQGPKRGHHADAEGQDGMKIN